MLILSRNPSESIVIGENVKLTVLSVNRGQVKIGISAPKEITVHREELYKKIKAEEKGGNK